MSVAVESETHQDSLIEDAVSALRQGLRTAAVAPVADRLAALGDVSQRILQRDASVAEVAGNARCRVPCRLSATRPTSASSSRVSSATPRPWTASYGSESRKSLRLVPRGLVCHWLAGNVPPARRVFLGTQRLGGKRQPDSPQ